VEEVAATAFGHALHVVGTGGVPLLALAHETAVEVGHREASAHARPQVGARGGVREVDGGFRAQRIDGTGADAAPQELPHLGADAALAGASTTGCDAAGAGAWPTKLVRGNDCASGDVVAVVAHPSERRPHHGGGAQAAARPPIEGGQRSVGHRNSIFIVEARRAVGAGPKTGPIKKIGGPEGLQHDRRDDGSLECPRVTDLAIGVCRRPARCFRIDNDGLRAIVKHPNVIGGEGRKHNEFHGKKSRDYRLAQWLRTPAGRYLLAWEQQHLDHAVVDLFGFHAVSWVTRTRWFACQPNAASLGERRWFAHRRIRLGQHGVKPTAIALQCDFDALPFDSQSLDLVVLPHALELARDPHRTLRESNACFGRRPRRHRRLQPDESLGLRQRLGHMRMGVGLGGRGPLFLPSEGEFIG